MSSSERLRVKGLEATWGEAPVLRDVSFNVRAGEFLVLMGPNGSGKTTLLRCLAGLEPVSAGTVELDGHDLAGVLPFRRGIGMLFQDPAMFPGRTVWENIAYGPQVARLPASEIETRVAEMVHRLRLEGFEDRLADRLSGGERQRVALARTLASRPRLVLLDEPFAAVDMELKAELRSEFREVLRSMEITAIHVTHDREEALFLGDRVAVLIDGRLEQVGDPATVHDAPATDRVARFLGYNLIGSGPGRVAVHPDDLKLLIPGIGGTAVATGPSGRSRVAYVRSDAGELLTARLASTDPPLHPGDRVGLRWERSIPFPYGAGEGPVKASESRPAASEANGQPR